MKKLFIVCIATIVCVTVCIAVKNDLNAVGCTWYVSISDEIYDFGSWDVGTTATGKTFTVSITNNGMCSSESGFSVSLTGDDADQYAINSNTCPSTIPDYGTSCSATVTFSPTAIGTLNDAEFQAGFESLYDKVALTGTGTEVISDSGSGNNDSDGCNATASTGVGYGKTSFTPSALGLIAFMGLVLGAATVRRRIRRK